MTSCIALREIVNCQARSKGQFAGDYVVTIFSQILETRVIGQKFLMEQMSLIIGQFNIHYERCNSNFTKNFGSKCETAPLHKEIS